jgi:predicted DNA-binding protein (UPF0251 family)
VTSDEFDSIKLTERLTFKESESVRLVLVHGFSIQKASEYYGVDTVKITEIIKTINAL